eukprot:351311-Chlamydomonas_euryale.AAC.2
MSPVKSRTALTSLGVAYVQSHWWRMLQPAEKRYLSWLATARTQPVWPSMRRSSLKFTVNGRHDTTALAALPKNTVSTGERPAPPLAGFACAQKRRMHSKHVCSFVACSFACLAVVVVRRSWRRWGGTGPAREVSMPLCGGFCVVVVVWEGITSARHWLRQAWAVQGAACSTLFCPPFTGQPFAY